MLESELPVLRDIFVGVIFAMLRIGAVFLIVPFLTKSVVTGLGRNAVMLSFTMMVIPLVLPTVPQATDVLFLVAVGVKEVVIGVIMGFLIALPFWMAEGVGFFIDNQRGAAMASSFDVMVGGQTSPFGMMLVKIVVVLFFSTGGFFTIIGVLYGSYVAWPVFTFFPTFRPEFSLFFLESGDHLMQTVVLFVSPVIICLFLTDFGLGLVNRFVPQLQVFFLAMPIKSALACLILVLYLGTLFTLYKEQFVYSNKLVSFLEQVLS